MPGLPTCSGKEAIKAFGALGYSPARQTGSHVFLKCEGRKSLSVPLHNELRPGLLRGLIRDAGINVEAFRSLL